MVQKFINRKTFKYINYILYDKYIFKGGKEMKTKIIGIIVCMLLIAMMAIPISALNKKTYPIQDRFR